jgi:hypothetical protein
MPTNARGRNRNEGEEGGPVIIPFEVEYDFWCLLKKGRPKRKGAQRTLSK